MLMSDPYKLAVRVAALPLCFDNNHAAAGVRGKLLELATAAAVLGK
jgi:hypothetical protein